MTKLNRRVDAVEGRTAAAEYCTCPYATIVIVDHARQNPNLAADVCSVCGGKQTTRRIFIGAEHADDARVTL